MSSVGFPTQPSVDLVEDHGSGEMIVGDSVADAGTEKRCFFNERSGRDLSLVGPKTYFSVKETCLKNPLLNEGDLSTNTAVGFGASEDDNSLANSQRTVVNKNNREVLQALSVIKEISEKIHLAESIQDLASQTFQQVVDSKTLARKKTEAKAAACIYIACRKQGVPRTFKEICAVSSVSKKEIARCFTHISKNLDTNLKQITIDDFVSRFCGNLHLSNSIQAAATLIAKRALETDLFANRSPISIAAAAIYIASQASHEKRSAKEIGWITGAAEGTIRKTYRLLYVRGRELLPEDFNSATPIEQLPFP